MAYSHQIALKAIIARLKAVTAITSITSSRIYSIVPQDATFPYILVEVSSQPFATKDDSSQLHNIIIHGFSRKSSPEEATDIAKQVFTALDRQESSVTLSSGNLIRLNYDNLNDTFLEADNVTWHSVINFQMLVA
jgi:hypothetical protein